LQNTATSGETLMILVNQKNKLQKLYVSNVKYQRGFKFTSVVLIGLTLKSIHVLHTHSLIVQLHTFSCE
jgi:hypothetical protein